MEALPFAASVAKGPVYGTSSVFRTGVDRRNVGGGRPSRQDAANPPTMD
jgi:hypothetical protein